jgi:hypothetical protein
MKNYLEQGSENSIYSSDFFSIGFDDGRSSFAWAEVISRLNKNPKVTIFFYDIDPLEAKDNIGMRDSLMYLKVKVK